MTRGHDKAKKWRMYCDELKCETRSEAFEKEPALQIFVDRGWFIAKLFGDVCPECLASGVTPTVASHSSWKQRVEP